MNYAEEVEVVASIRREITMAEMMEERCHHFTKGDCDACRREKVGRQMRSLIDEIEVSFEMIEAHDAWYSPWAQMLNELWGDLTSDIGELSHP